MLYASTQLCAMVWIDPLPEFQVEDITFDSYQVELLFKGEKQLLMVNHGPGTRDKMNRKTHILVLAVMETLQVGDLTKESQKSNKRIKKGTSKETSKHL